MDTLVDLSWRAYPAGVMVVLGVVAMVRGIASIVRGARIPIHNRSKLIVGVGGFRIGIIGMALAGLAGAWIGQLDWLLVLSLAIGGEEALESSVILYALRRGRRLAEASTQAA